MPSQLPSTDGAAVIAGAHIAPMQVEFKGRNMLDMTPDELRRIRGDRISVVFQDPMTSLNPVLSIDRQMTDIQYRDNLSKSAKIARAARMLTRLPSGNSFFPTSSLRQANS